MDLSKNAPFSSYKGQKPYIFISYAHKDAEIVFPYLSGLHDLGYRIWYDEGIEPGTEWHDAVAAAIVNCALMLVFLSPGAVDSANVRNEINFAIARNKREIYIYIKETVLSDGLALQIGSSQAIMEYKIQDKERFRALMRTSLPAGTMENTDKYSKEQVQALHSIFENITRQMDSYFSGVLRMTCEISVVSVEETFYKEFNDSLSSPVFLAILGMSPLQGSIILSIPPPVAFGIINRLFGGSGRSDEDGRPFTEIEVAVLERILAQMMPLLAEPWEKIAKVALVLERIETNGGFVQIVGSSEAVAIITMRMTTPSIIGFIRFCIPRIAIQPIAKQLTASLNPW